MTKGDKIKLRAELAGKAMAAILGNNDLLNGLFENNPENGDMVNIVTIASRGAADALMAELGISLDKED